MIQNLERTTEDDVQDNHNPATADEAPPGEPGAAGEVIKRNRFGIGSKATILMGLTMGAVSVITIVTAVSGSVSKPP
jgi:hypothetical protein